MQERFWKFVVKTETCWNWTGGHTPKGYGTFPSTNHGHVYAHRFSYELHVGPIPAGMFVCHHCDNPACVNPTHLFLGTATDNMHDCAVKGRTAHTPHPGEHSGSHKLTDSMVRDIRAKYAAGNVTQNSLAQEYGVSRIAIDRVVNRRSWQHIA